MPNAVLQRLVSEREDALEAADAILAMCEDEERDPSQTERDLMTRHRTRASELEDPINEMLELEEARERGAAQRERISRAVGPARPRTDGRAPADDDDDADGGYPTFAAYARDALITRIDRIGALAGPELRERAAERLNRVAVHTITSDVVGLTPPQHIAQIFETINRERPVVASTRQIGLTAGKLTWPSVTARPTVAKQAVEKTEAAYSKMTVVMREELADTFLGAGNLSWQTINWSTPDALALFFDLMAEAYAEQTEAEACGVMDAGALAGPTVGSADLAGWMAAIAAAAGLVRSGGGRANTVYMDAVTGYEVLGLVAVENPVFLTVGGGSLGDASGNIGGLRFLISDGFDPDTVIVGDSTKMLCAETSGAPVEMRAVEPSIGGLEVGVIGAFAAALALPTAFVRVTPPTTP